MNRLMSLCLLSSLAGCWSSRELATDLASQPLAEGEDERVAACEQLAAQLPILECSTQPETIAAGGPDGTAARAYYQAYCSELPAIPAVGTPPTPLFCMGSVGSPVGPWVPPFACRRDSAPLLTCIAERRSCNPAQDCAQAYLGAGCDPSSLPSGSSSDFVSSCGGSADNLVGVSMEPHADAKDPLYGKYGFAISNCRGHEYRALCTMSALCDSFDCECSVDGVVTQTGHVVMSNRASYQDSIPTACGWSSQN